MLAKTSSRTYCFVFVCQAGELEIKSMLLVASLKRFLRREYELVAAIPGPESRWGRPSPSTLKLLRTLGGRTVPIINKIDANYPIGNKVSCLDIGTSAEKIVFLDSDILCMREFYDTASMDPPFNAKPADLVTFTKDMETWRHVYATAELPMPTVFMSSTVSGETMPRYFNAGMIVVDRQADLGKAWLECCLRIDSDEEVPEKRPWLDQIALPVAVAKLGLEYGCLDESYNYPAHIKPLDPVNLPYFCHYHWPAIIRHERLAKRLVMDLARQHAPLRDAIQRDLEWRKCLES